ncbi:hypothetical protein [Nocardia sp.]
MILVWLIDILVSGVRILGGGIKVNPVLRFGLWVAVVAVLAAGVGVLGAGLYFLQQYLSGPV